ncbi:hypothetical protein KM043_005068 [Ampulex compressa]|nr:hypothetical protein KM043_005068 [Ampulex compressa]
MAKRSLGSSREYVRGAKECRTERLVPAVDDYAKAKKRARTGGYGGRSRAGDKKRGRGGAGGGRYWRTPNFAVWTALSSEPAYRAARMKEREGKALDEEREKGPGLPAVFSTDSELSSLLTLLFQFLGLGSNEILIGIKSPSRSYLAEERRKDARSEEICGKTGFYDGEEYYFV